MLCTDISTSWVACSAQSDDATHGGTHQEDMTAAVSTCSAADRIWNWSGQAAGAEHPNFCSPSGSLSAYVGVICHLRACAPEPTCNTVASWIRALWRRRRTDLDPLRVVQVRPSSQSVRHLVQLRDMATARHGRFRASLGPARSRQPQLWTLFLCDRVQRDVAPQCRPTNSGSHHRPKGRRVAS